jgi:hypothetical protein
MPVGLAHGSHPIPGYSHEKSERENEKYEDCEDERKRGIV